VRCRLMGVYSSRHELRASNSPPGLPAASRVQLEAIRGCLFGIMTVPTLVLENFTASTNIWELTQAIKGHRWMPWRQMPMKDVGGCEKSR
jgi:hypothetical protein